MPITRRGFDVAVGSRVFVWPDRQAQEDWCEFRLRPVRLTCDGSKTVFEEVRAAASTCETNDREVELTSNRLHIRSLVSRCAAL